MLEWIACTRCDALRCDTIADSYVENFVGDESLRSFIVILVCSAVEKRYLDQLVNRTERMPLPVDYLVSPYL